MPRRLHATLADYVIVAINPALIMVLIGSLVYFLLEMFYQGQYPARLHYCLTLYIFAAVLVSRISMKEGWDHAAPFGGALIVVIVLALHKFVDYAGTNLVQVGWLINYVLIALVAWCAHRLTWDCTLIDESQDTSGEGLLQTVGFDTNENKEKLTSKADKPKKAVKAADEALPSIAVDSSEFTATTRASRKSTKKSWWQQFVERRRRPHAPGVWIVYFSLAALPLFGLGQAFIPASNIASRRYAFVLLSIYVACGLGLLLTTSFLGLRRYLRQRKLEMPAAMTGTWLTTGAILIVALLIFTALLPRPNAEYAISQLPSIGSKHHDSSRVSTGKEGTKDDQSKPAPGKHSRPDDPQEKEQPEKGPDPNQNGTERDSNNTGKGAANENERHKDGGSSKPQDDGAKDNSSNNGPSQTNESQNSDSKSDASTQQKSSNNKAQSKENSDSSNASDTKQEQNIDGQKQSDEQNAKSEETPQSDSDNPSQESNSSPEIQPPEITSLGGQFLAVLKWLFYGVLMAVAIWWSVRNWALLVAWLRSLLTAWQNLFSRRRELPETIQIASIHRSFYEFTDPFATGMASRYPPEELVRYSFEAFEAWARDQEWPRETNQTAWEFARIVGEQAPHIATSARTLADLYSRAAYAPGTLSADSVGNLRSLWESMKTPQLVA